MKQIALDVGLPAAPTLAGYVAAGDNEAALRHLQLWLGDGHTALSPVPTYLWGAAGSGKTHLLKAVQGELASRGAAVGWLDASVAEPPAFDARWRVLLMDEVQHYSAVQQHAAFNWFVNAMSAADGQPRGLLAAGSLPPADLPLRDDLRSRLGWGHVFQLHEPDDAVRRRVLREQARARGLALPDEVTDFVLARFSRDLGSLALLLDRLDAYSLETRRALTIPLVKAMLEDS